VHRPQRAQQGQEERSRCPLVVLLIGVKSVIAGVAVIRSSSFGFRAATGCGSRPDE